MKLPGVNGTVTQLDNSFSFLGQSEHFWKRRIWFTSAAIGAHLCVMCEGHITSVVVGSPSDSTWMVPNAINVFPAPHPATIRAALALRRYFAVPVMATA